MKEVNQLSFLDELYDKENKDKSLEKKMVSLYRLCHYFSTRCESKELRSKLEDCSKRFELILSDLRGFRPLGIESYHETNIIDSRAIGQLTEGIYHVIRDHDMTDIQNKIIYNIIKDLEKK